MDAAIFADALGIDRFYKLSNIDHIYTADPNIDPKARLIKEIRWTEYDKLFGITSESKHIPNNNLPIDPYCANFCKKKKISVFVSGGETLDNATSLEEVFESGTFLH